MADRREAVAGEANRGGTRRPGEGHANRDVKSNGHGKMSDCDGLAGSTGSDLPARRRRDHVDIASDPLAGERRRQEPAFTPGVLARLKINDPEPRVGAIGFGVGPFWAEANVKTSRGTLLCAKKMTSPRPGKSRLNGWSEMRGGEEPHRIQASRRRPQQFQLRLNGVVGNSVNCADVVFCSASIRTSNRGANSTFGACELSSTLEERPDVGSNVLGYRANGRTGCGRPGSLSVACDPVQRQTIPGAGAWITPGRDADRISVTHAASPWAVRGVGEGTRSLAIRYLDVFGEA